MSDSIGAQVAFWKAEFAKRPELAQDEEAVQLLASLESQLDENPIWTFEPNCEQQEGFIRSTTRVSAALAGNQSGKTVSLIVRVIRDCVDRDVLPPFLAQTKMWDPPAYGWVLCPTEEKVYDSILPTIQEWCPKSQFRGGVFDKSWNGNRMQLTFKNGSQISFKTYKQHESTLGGARLHFVGYDEPPPRRHRDECMTRLLRYGGNEVFAMTPLETNVAWVKRDIWKQREAPDISVFKWSMHDNKFLDPAAKKFILDSYANDLWRRAREFGDFVDVGGLVYPDFERIVVPMRDGKPPWPAEFIRKLEVCVAIDPGIRNAGFVYGGFDRDGTLWVFDDDLLQDSTPADYAQAIDEKLGRWGIRKESVEFIIDPAARARAQVNAETMETALARLGIYCTHGQNDVQAGVGQIRARINAEDANGERQPRIWVSGECRGLRDEVDELAAEDRDDGEFKIIKRNDHRADALRYLAMHRPYDPVSEAYAPQRNLGWQPGTALPARHLRVTPAAPPMGAMS